VRNTTRDATHNVTRRGTPETTQRDNTHRPGLRSACCSCCFVHVMTGFFDQSFHIPLIIRDPRPQADATRGALVSSTFSENIDIMPTILQWTGAAIPASCDGFSLLPFLVRGKRPGLLLFALRLPRAYLGKWSYFMEKSQ
jgi:hypothetical protein